MCLNNSSMGNSPLSFKSCHWVQLVSGWLVVSCAAILYSFWFSVPAALHQSIYTHFLYTVYLVTSGVLRQTNIGKFWSLVPYLFSFVTKLQETLWFLWVFCLLAFFFLKLHFVLLSIKRIVDANQCRSWISWGW